MLWQKVFFSLLFCMIYACHTSDTSPESKQEADADITELSASVTGRDTFSITTTSFLTFYNEFFRALKEQDVQQLDRFIDTSCGLWFVYSEGALPQVVQVRSFSGFRAAGSQKTFFDYYRADQLDALCVIDSLPRISCDTPYPYSKRGCFTQPVNRFAGRGWELFCETPVQKSLLEFCTKDIAYTTLHTDFFELFFSYRSGSWRIIAINLTRPCQA